MKKFAIIISIFLLWGMTFGFAVGCNYQKKKIENGSNNAITYNDSSYIIMASAFNEKKLLCDTLQKINDSLKSFKCGTLQKKYDSIKRLNNSIKSKLFLAQYKVEKVKFYIKIVERNPSQKVFYLGWTKRAVE